METNPNTINPSTFNASTRNRGGIDLTLRTMFAVAVAVFIGSLLYAAQPGPSARTLMHFDGPTFDSVHSLSWTSDVVVQAKVIKYLGPQIDHGGEEPLTVDADGEEITPAGLPVLLYEARVQDSLAGDLQKGDIITLAMLNHNKIESHHVTPLKRGKKYVFFMAKMDSGNVLSLDTAGQDLYLPLNYNNGVLPTDGKSVQLNSWILGIDDDSAALRSNELSELEASQGSWAVEAELKEQANVELDFDVLRQTVEAAAR